MHPLSRVAFLFYLFTLSAFGGKVTDDLTANDLKQMEKAHFLVDEFRSKLRENLQKALKEKGEAKSVPSCKVTAKELSRLPKDDSWRVGRTSHKLRNPTNVPKTWMKPHLDKFASTSRSEHPKNVLVKLEGGGYGYLEPIYVEAACLRCHGKSIKPEVLAELKEFYPYDAATDFNVGDFRGFVWVEAK